MPEYCCWNHTYCWRHYKKTGGHIL